MSTIPRNKTPEAGVDLEIQANYEQFLKWIDCRAYRHERNKAERIKLVGNVLKRVRADWDMLNGSPWPLIYSWVGQAIDWEGLSHVKQEMRQPNIYLLPDEESKLENSPGAENAPDPAGEFEANDNLEYVLQSLKPLELQVTKLRKVDGWTTKEVASHLGYSPKYIRKILCVAIGKMRRIQAQEDVSPSTE